MLWWISRALCAFALFGGIAILMYVLTWMEDSITDYEASEDVD